MVGLINYRPRVVSNSCVHVIRKIKGSGHLTVAKNQEVSPHDILGTSVLSPGFSVINLAHDLAESPIKAIASLKKAVGVPIYKGELLAQKSGFFGKKNVIAPTDCVIDKLNETTGEVTLRLLPKQIPLLSGVFGIVDEISTLTGEVFIKTMATQVIGVFGSGRERGGFLKIVGSPSELLDVGRITSDMKGQIIVSGGLIFGLALKKAMEYQLDGVISGGINMDDYLSIAGSLYEANKSHSEVGLSVLATEGFGPISIGNDIFTQLRKFEGRYIFINGFQSHLVLPDGSDQAIIQSRKISLPSPIGAVRHTPEVKTIPFKINQKVRIIWPPFTGSQGVITSVDGTLTQLESGVLAQCVTVDLPSRKIKVPLNNLEAI